MPVPDFSPGEVLTAAAMDSIGLWLVKSQAVVGSPTSVTVTGAFSADYDNYRVVLNGIVPSAQDSFRVRFGSATTGYYGSMYYDQFTGAATSTLRTNNANANYLALNESGTSSATIAFDVTAPFLTTATNHYGLYYGRGFAGWSSGQLAAGSHSSITILTDGAGTMTGGTIRVYGYRN
jgi:hypothetical protein